MAPQQTIDIIDGFFNLYYVENRGMAFGTTLGNSVWAKYALSVFRLAAIVAIAMYIRKLLQDTRIHRGLVYAMALIFAGAAGNLIDGMCYDYLFEMNPDISWNWIRDANDNFVYVDGAPVVRDSGFLLGSVVDMFQFTSRWPSFFPEGMAGEDIFGAIWNVADFSISLGVALIILRYRTFFRKAHEKTEVTVTEDGMTTEVIVEVDDSIGIGRWAIYFGVSVLIFFGVLIGGSHLWAKTLNSIDPGIIAILSLAIAFISYWSMREYIKR